VTGVPESTAAGAEPAETTSAPPTVVDPATAVPVQQRNFPNGRVLGERYRLDGRIAAGGMGEVWRGTDQLLGRPVAVKLLSAAHATDEQFQERFRAEARYAASLSHPGIARVFDYGESAAGPDGAYPPAVDGAYLVMELVEGQPLSTALAHEGRMSSGATLDVVAQAARALAAAHEAGIVHRDIKPGNLLITPDGQVKITDFGIARAMLAAHLTQSGMVMGTAQYVSPEQASAGPITTATDIYSLGVVAYECLAGHPPFAADTPVALALAHVKQPPPTLPGDVPPQVAALVGQMLAKEPADRPGSAQLVADRASSLRGARPADDDPWIIRSAGEISPAAGFAGPGPGGAGQGPAGTAPMQGAKAPPPRSRRGVLVLTAGAAVAAAAAGTIAIMAAGGHPATAGTSGRAHRAKAPAAATGHKPGVLGQTSPAVQPPAGSPTSPPHASPSPTAPVTSSPAPGSPSPSTSPTSPPSVTPTPTPSNSTSGGPSSAASASPPAANTSTQDG
jgi:serine/threonine-protein kinase